MRKSEDLHAIILPTPQLDVIASVSSTYREHVERALRNEMFGCVTYHVCQYIVNGS